MADTVSIVIPVYRQWDYTNALLKDISRLWSPDEIIIVDDSGNLDTITELGCSVWKTTLPIQYIKNQSNLGFLLAANVGIQSATGDIIICMNNDVRIYDIERPLGRSWDFIKKYTTKDSCIGGKLLMNAGWNNFDGRIFPYLEGWLMSATRENWGTGFDVRYAPSDFEDVDKSTEWVIKGIQLLPMPEHHVVHLGAKSYGYTAEREARTKRNRQLFAEKWGVG